MIKLYSKVEPGILLHIINRAEDISSVRQDLCPSDEFLQMACFELPEGKTFRAHKHIPKESTHTTTQESWIVIRGKIKAILYDLDDTILEEIVLNQGDCSITFRAGHNYECMEDGSLVYEAKTGPYLGLEKDKVFVDANS